MISVSLEVTVTPESTATAEPPTVKVLAGAAARRFVENTVPSPFAPPPYGHPIKR